MKAPSPHAVSLLATPTWPLVRRGTLATWGYFSALFALFICGQSVTNIVIAIAWEASLERRSGSFTVAALGDALLSVFVALITGIIAALLAAIVALACLGPAMFIGRLLAPVKVWPVHLATYTVLGASVTLALVAMIGLIFDPAGHATPPLIVSSWVAPLAGLTAVCTAAGWATAWLRAIAWSEATTQSSSPASEAHLT